MLNDYGKGLFKPLLSISNAAWVIAVIFTVALFKPSSSELASWVQAIGSIVSIWGAFAISQRQMVKVNLNKIKDSISLCHMYRTLLDQALKDSKLFCYVAGQNFPLPSVKSRMSGRNLFTFASVYEALKDFPVKDIGSEIVVISHICVISSMRNMMSCMEDLKNLDDKDKYAVKSVLEEIVQEDYWIQHMGIANLAACKVRIDELNREIGCSEP